MIQTDKRSHQRILETETGVPNSFSEERFFRNWDRKMLGEAQDFLAKSLSFFKVPLAEELLSNASDSIMLAGKAGKGEVRVKITIGQTLRVEVEDNGGGINPVIEPYIFKWIPDSLPAPLLKINLPRELAFGQMRSGLRDLNKFVVEHGGQIGFKNFGQDNGALFWFEIPVKSFER